LGQGGQGRVWLAIRELDGQRCAVKILFGHAGTRSRARLDQSFAALSSQTTSTVRTRAELPGQSSLARLAGQFLLISPLA